MSSAAHPDGRWSFDVLTVVDVHDGDSVKMTVDAGFGVSFTFWLRIAGINAPELDANGGTQARDFLAAKLNGNPKGLGLVVVTHRRVTSDEDERSFVRYVGDLLLFSNSVEQVDVANLLVEAGHAARIRYGLEKW